ncbi:MAG: 3-hydroxyanthranilate 3,4-dioxygenase [Pseudomonadota bacterium]
MKPLQAFNLANWIEKHREVLQPPVCNKQVFEDAEFIVMVVGGPNSRRDYHYDEGEEIFYQIEGDMLLRTIQDDTRVDIPIREGDLFLLPPRVPHSPQRFKDTVGIVVERKRRAGELDGFLWYCDACDHKLHEEYLELKDIERDLPPVFERFNQNESFRRCKNCGELAAQDN